MAQAHRGGSAVFRQWTTAQLVEALRAWDINYLMVSRRVEQASAVGRKTKRPPIEQLLPALARSDEPRVRDALIGLLLLHPEIAGDIVRVASRARSQGENELAEQIITLALASLYLQRIWWFQLALAYEAFSALDEALFAPWWLERDLPSPSTGYGEPGLRRLAIYEQHRVGTAANLVGDWQNQAHHVITQGWNRSSRENRPAKFAEQYAATLALLPEPD